MKQHFFPVLCDTGLTHKYTEVSFTMGKVVLWVDFLGLFTQKAEGEAFRKGAGREPNPTDLK